MASSNDEAIEMFMSITGVSEATAIQKLQEHGGDLNEAVNAHFGEDQNRTHQTSISAPVDDIMDIDDAFETERSRPPYSLLSSARNLSPFSLLDRYFGGSIFDSFTGNPRSEPFVSHPREVREIPIEVKDLTENSGHSGGAPTVEDVTGSVHDHGPEIHGTVTIDDDDDDDGISTAPALHSTPAAPETVDLLDYSSDIEEEMIRAAIEASKRVDGLTSKQLGVHRNQENSMSQQMGYDAEDPELAHVVSLSLKTAEQEKALRELEGNVGESEVIESSSATDPEKEVHEKLNEEQEIERQLAAKEASLPPEPAPNDENAVTLLVRMPDGSGRGRGFLKSDKLQYVFDFIDVGRVVKPGTYRVVRPYPRRAFSASESALTLNEIGLTSKQEALFIEPI